MHNANFSTVENAYNEVIGSQKMISLYPFFVISVATQSEFNHEETGLYTGRHIQMRWQSKLAKPSVKISAQGAKVFKRSKQY